MVFFYKNDLSYLILPPPLGKNASTVLQHTPLITILTVSGQYMMGLVFTKPAPNGTFVLVVELYKGSPDDGALLSSRKNGL